MKSELLILRLLFWEHAYCIKSAICFELAPYNLTCKDHILCIYVFIPENLNFIFVKCFPSKSNDEYRIEINNFCHLCHLWESFMSQQVLWTLLMVLLVQGWIIERTKMIDKCGLRYYTLILCPVRQRLNFIVNNIPEVTWKVSWHEWKGMNGTSMDETTNLANQMCSDRTKLVPAKCENNVRIILCP